jgi:hypothetical protein
MHKLQVNLRQAIEDEIPYIQDSSANDRICQDYERALKIGYLSDFIVMNTEEDSPSGYNTCSNAEICLGLPFDKVTSMLLPERLRAQRKLMKDAEKFPDLYSHFLPEYMSNERARELGIEKSKVGIRQVQEGSLPAKVQKSTWNVVPRTQIIIQGVLIDGGTVRTESLFWKTLLSESVRNREYFFAGRLYDPRRADSDWSGNQNTWCAIYLP